MNRPICVLAIISIIIIIGLHLKGVVFLDFDKIYSYINNNIEYQGIIIEENKENEYKCTYIVKLQSKDKLINGRKFMLYTNKDKKLKYGDKIIFKGEYKKPNASRNYGGFDYSLYLKTKKIYGSFKANNIKIVSENNINIFQKSIYEIREYIRQTLKDNMDNEKANLCIGLITGEKEGISDNIKESFKNSSLTHMLAISGTHFSYLILFITYINKYIKRKRLGQTLLIICIIIFMNIANNTPSVVRAGISCILIILSSMLKRRSDLWNNIGISILIQMFNNPYVIFDIGFELSYGGVIGIALFYELIFNQLEQTIKINNKIVNHIIQSISLSLSANIIIIPIIIFNFNTISFSFIISNLLAGPMLGIIIISLYSLIILSLIFKSLLNPLFYILELLINILVKMADLCSKLPFSKIYVVTPNILLLLLFYIFLIVLKESPKKRIAICLIIVIILNFIIPIQSSKKSNLVINFIDVGQGDSTLIRLNNKSILIDGGGSTYLDDFDVGEKTLFPYLLDRGIIKLDYILVSHFDRDHCQGLNFVMENMKVENVIISKLGQESKEFDDFIQLAKKKNINIIYVRKGDIIKIGEGIIEILYPDNNEIQENSKNNNAIVFKIKWKQISILFTGDIEKIAETKILSMYSDNLEELNSTILKVAHHGSKTSTMQKFIEVVNPKVALIGVGKDNKFGHPNNDVIKRLEDLSCKIYRTDKNGEISIEVNDKMGIRIIKNIEN